MRISDWSSDVCSSDLHLMLGDRSRGTIGGAEFDLMKPSAYLINTGRAEIVDQAALVDALTRGRIAGAALDVYDHEPLPADHRSEERRVGKECVRTCGSRWSPDH